MNNIFCIIIDRMLDRINGSDRGLIERYLKLFNEKALSNIFALPNILLVH